MNRNKNIFLLLVMIVSMLLLASGIATAEPQRLPDMSTVAMSTSSTVLVALNENGPAVYSPQYQYVGIYDRTRLYRRYPGAIQWRVGGQPALLENVTCGSARSRLARYGIWSGALQADGTCWNSEPQDFAVGNYLNYLIFNHPGN